MDLKTNVVKHQYSMHVAAQTKDGAVKLFAHAETAESREAALLQLQSYLSLGGMKLVKVSFPKTVLKGAGL